MNRILYDAIIKFMICIGLMFLVVMSGRVYSDWQNSQAEQETVYCTVQEKDNDFLIVNKISIQKHQLLVSPEGCPEIKEEVSVSSTLYDRVEVGDSVKCKITYNSEKITSIDISE